MRWCHLIANSFYDICRFDRQVYVCIYILYMLLSIDCHACSCQVCRNWWSIVLSPGGSQHESAEILVVWCCELISYSLYIYIYIYSLVAKLILHATDIWINLPPTTCIHLFQSILVIGNLLLKLQHEINYTYLHIRYRKRRTPKRQDRTSTSCTSP